MIDSISDTIKCVVDTIHVHGSIIVQKACEHHSEGLFTWTNLGSFALVVMALAILLFVFKWLKSVRDFIFNYLIKIAFWDLIAGFALYFIGYINTDFNILESIVQAGGRAFLSAFSMFVFDSDLIEVREACHESPLYMILFALVHFVGVLISTIVIIRILGNRLSAWFGMIGTRMSQWLGWRKVHAPKWWKWMWSLVPEPKENVYVFWGLNEASITLANSIENKFASKNDEKISKNYQLIFVETPSERELEIKEFSLTHFFTSSLHKDEKVNRIKLLKGQILYPKSRLIDVGKESEYSDKDDASENENKKDYLKYIGLKKLKNYCEYFKHIHFFFLSEDKFKNVQDMLILKEYFRLRGKNGELLFSPCVENCRVDLYCGARRNNQHQIYEEQDRMKYLYEELMKLEKRLMDSNCNAQSNDDIKCIVRTHIVDDANLAVSALKSNPLYQPVNYVTVNEKAQVTSSFHTFILGFAQTGRDAFRFLYEFSAFVDVNHQRSPFHATIYDTNMDKIIGDFLAQAPALASPYEHNTTLNFKKDDVHSCEFWKDLEKNIHQLKYVVVALGDDELNLNTAINIFKFALSHRDHKKDGKFSIFVRVYKKEYEKEAETIIKHFANNEMSCHIELFGTMNDIYTYENIVNENKRKKALLFSEIYGMYRDEAFSQEKIRQIDKLYIDYRNSLMNPVIIKEKKGKQSTLFEREKEDIQSSLFERWYSDFMTLQNFSNAWHINTKFELLKTAIIKQELYSAINVSKLESDEKKIDDKLFKAVEIIIMKQIKDEEVYKKDVKKRQVANIISLINKIFKDGICIDKLQSNQEINEYVENVFKQIVVHEKNNSPTKMGSWFQTEEGIKWKEQQLLISHFLLLPIEVQDAIVTVYDFQKQKTNIDVYINDVFNKSKDRIIIVKKLASLRHGQDLKGKARYQEKVKDEQGNVQYKDIDDGIKNVIDTLAICEHLRWNALGELQGFTPKFDDSNGGKDKVGKRLGCLRPWDRYWVNCPYLATLTTIAPDKLKYDYNTIDVSMELRRLEDEYDIKNHQ